MSKWARILLWFGAFVILGGAYLWFFGVQTFLMLETRRIARRTPIAKNISAELADPSVSMAPGNKLSYLGYEFVVPWQDVDEEKTKIIGNKVAIVFHSGNAILLCVVPPRNFINMLSKEMNSYPEVLKRMYGQEVLHSDYALKRVILESTPSKITLFTSREDAVGLSMVILMKTMMTPMDDSEIYSIRSHDFQGFQFGDPLRRPRKIAVELYADDVELVFYIGQKDKGPTPAITQAEINRIIQTAHKTLPELQSSVH